jgi:nicotinamidase-related amidase
MDMINPMRFDGASRMLTAAVEAASAIAGLQREARSRGIPVLYVNDNFGRWHGHRDDLIAYAMQDDAPGAEMVRILEPGPDDYLVIKPQFSGFYASNLPALLPRLGVERLILTGIAADICVLFTAADAHMREYDLWVPQNAVASESAERRDWALNILGHSMNATVDPTTELGLDAWIGPGG